MYPCIPSTYRLRQYFPCTEEQACAARDIWHAVVSEARLFKQLQKHVPALLEQHSGPDDLRHKSSRISVALQALDILLGTSGVEHLYDVDPELTWLASYLDIGDPYAETLVLRKYPPLSLEIMPWTYALDSYKRSKELQQAFKAALNESQEWSL